MKRVKKNRRAEDAVFPAESFLSYEEYEPTVGSSTGLTSLRNLAHR